MSTRHSRLTLACVALAGALLLSSCSDGSDGSTPETTVVRAATTTTQLPDTPLPEGGTGSTTTTSEPLDVVVSLPIGVVFPDISLIDPLLAMRPLAAGDLDRLEARFREDDRVDVFLDEVDARGVYQGEELVAVAVAVAVAPGAVSASGFVESFVQGATEGGLVNPTPVEVLDQELTSWLDDDTGHLLWSYENLFLIVSGRDPVLVRDISEAVVTMVLAPPPPPTTLPPCPEEPAAEDGADSEGADQDGSTGGEAADGESSEGGEGESTTTTAPCAPAVPAEEPVEESTTTTSA